METRQLASSIESFCNDDDLNNIIKEPACLKNQKTYLALIIFLLTDFGALKVFVLWKFAMALSDFYAIRLTVMEKSFWKYKRRIIKFGD